MSNFPTDLDLAISTVYNSALESGELIFTPSEIFKSKETKFDVECEICYAPALAKKPHGILPVVEADPAPKIFEPSTPVIKQIEKVNPFLPHSPALYVSDIGEEHKILLNKFCIVEKHFLIITKEFHRQTEPLTPEDLVSVWIALKSLKNSENALAYFNCGSRSGASQPHKHMQVLPLETPAPITTLVRECTARRPGKKATQPGDLFSVPFNCIHHAVLLQSTEATGKSQEDILIDAYIQLMDAMIMSIREYSEDETVSDEDRNLATSMRSSFDYNWILTTEFMMIVPRRKESAPSGDITLDINSLGFAGMILAKTPEELKLAQDRGVIELVSETGFWFGPTGNSKSEEEQNKKRDEQAAAEKQISSALSNM
ncbi:bifunctional AP-4-A phosphorylase/ADP sulfurylase [Entomortierella beljakovae]|nr:bifunctional AP-4-A phosphorylase/ADP sulfurylase [Entomortierella beljakovae]